MKKRQKESIKLAMEVLVVNPQVRDQSNNELAKNSRNWLSELFCISNEYRRKFYACHVTENASIHNVEVLKGFMAQFSIIQLCHGSWQESNCNVE